jgi:hypothetical protein
VRPGPVEELRYSLRSLAANVHHDNVWIFGSAPSWVAHDPDLVRVVARGKQATKYETTTGHVRAMCKHPGVSDPFVLWMDDVYAVRPVGEMPRLHLGPLDVRLRRYVSLRSPWAQGMRATAELLKEMFPDRALLSYEAHAPLIVHKAAMLEALALADRMPVKAPHKRTLYGNIAELGGIELHGDPKWVTQSQPPPKGAWLSSDDASFRTVTQPILRWLFPDPGPYETGSGRGRTDQDGKVLRSRSARPRRVTYGGTAQERLAARRAALERRKRT